MKKENKKVKLELAMIRLLEAQNYSSISIKDLAAEAEVKLGNVFYHYKTKKAIVESIYSKLSENARQRLLFEPEFHEDTTLKEGNLVLKA